MKESRTIKKVKINSKGGVNVVYDIISDGDLQTVVFQSDDEPLQSFYDAMEALKTTVQRICEYTDKYMDTLRVSGLSIFVKKERRSVTIHAIKDLESAHRPLNIHTPLLDEPNDESEEGDPMTLIPDDVSRIQHVIAEAEKYLKGKRAPKPEQLSLVS